MTSKELLYVEDALGHEQFMQCSSQNASNQLQDTELSQCIQNLKQQHQGIYQKFLNLL